MFYKRTFYYNKHYKIKLVLLDYVSKNGSLHIFLTCAYQNMSGCTEITNSRNRFTGATDCEFTRCRAILVQGNETQLRTAEGTGKVFEKI